ncbi:hypothetical protein NSX65_24965, partial [Salmonella enterica]|nr:hypothetical protein [Salmonella enterica]
IGNSILNISKLELKIGNEPYFSKKTTCSKTKNNVDIHNNNITKLRLLLGINLGVNEISLVLDRNFSREPRITPSSIPKILSIR